MARTTKSSFRLSASAVGVVSVLVLSGAPPASAGLVEEAVGTVTSALPGEVVPGVPGPQVPPQGATPAAPPVQVVAPTTPPVAKPPVQVPHVTPQTGTPPTSSQSVSGVAGGAETSVEATTGMSTHTAQEAGAPARHDGGRPDDGRPESAGAPGPGAKGRSVGSAQVPPLRPWLAYVWPAIALGPAGGLLTGLLASLDAAPLSMSGVSRLPSGPAANTAASAPSQPERRAAANPSVADTRVSFPSGAAISLFVLLISAVALTALLLFAVRSELGSLSHWPH